MISLESFPPILMRVNWSHFLLYAYDKNDACAPQLLRKFRLCDFVKSKGIEYEFDFYSFSKPVSIKKIAVKS